MKHEKEAEQACHDVAMALHAAERLVEHHWDRPGTTELLSVAQMILDRMRKPGE